MFLEASGMSLNLEFNKLSVSSANVLTNNNNVECKVPLTEEEGKNILNVDVITYLLSAECGDKEVRYSGRAVFTILYKSEGVIKMQTSTSPSTITEPTVQATPETHTFS